MLIEELLVALALVVHVSLLTVEVLYALEVLGCLSAVSRASCDDWAYTLTQGESFDIVHFLRDWFVEACRGSHALQTLSELGCLALLDAGAIGW